MTRFGIPSLFLAPVLAVAALSATARFDGPQAGAVPPAVVVAEGLAEDVQADLDARNWAMARTRVAELQTNRAELRVALPAAKTTGYEAALDSLIAQVGRQARSASLQSANRMSRAIVTILADYDVTVPVQVGSLDVAGRDAIYGAEARRWQDASAALAELHANYATVRAHVAGKDPVLDTRFAQRLNELDRAVAGRNAARVRSIATALLDDVDLIERTY
jgi:hypothetical protein